MSKRNSTVQVKAVAAGLEQASDPARVSGPEERNLDVFIGKWINAGHTISRPGVPSTQILTSDIYEWAPGRFFVIHSAYGLIGDITVEAVEIIGYDPCAGCYRSQLFDSQGNASVSQVRRADGAWTWTGERTRYTATFSDDGNVQTAHHEMSEDGLTWQPSMDVTLRKIT
jgi:hypothetical protein